MLLDPGRVVSIANATTDLLLQCKHGAHKLEALYATSENGGGVSTVVRWCTTCGAVVVDTDVDNRTKPGDVTKMKVPQIAQAAFDEFRLRK